MFAQAQNDQRRRGDGGSSDRGGRGNFSPEEAQSRMLNALRERFDINDDEEWKVISERVTKVSEARRAASSGGFGMFGGGRGGPPGGGGGDRGGPGGGGDRNRTGRGGAGSSELTALSTAVRDKLPDAELKVRLERLREIRRDNEAKLLKAQEELRAVLSVRQEAIAVVFGLLP